MGSRGSQAAGLGLGIALAVLGLAVPLREALPSTAQAQAQAIADPLAQAGLVFVLHQGQWRPASLFRREQRLVEGQPRWFYQVQFLDGAMELRAHLTADQIVPLAAAQARGLTDRVYDLSTQTGIDEILAAHNDLRRRVGVRSLVWAPELAASAQTWANVLLAQNAFYHSPDRQRRRGTVGENLHRRRSGPGRSYATPSQAVAGWIAEGAHYTYQTNRCAPGRQCGHYLQMVWADSRQVGCAVARTADARLEIWACHYYPGGIVLNRRPY